MCIHYFCLLLLKFESKASFTGRRFPIVVVPKIKAGRKKKKEIQLRHLLWQQYISSNNRGITTLEHLFFRKGFSAMGYELGRRSPFELSGDWRATGAKPLIPLTPRLCVIGIEWDFYYMQMRDFLQ